MAGPPRNTTGGRRKLVTVTRGGTSGLNLAGIMVQAVTNHSDTREGHSEAPWLKGDDGVNAHVSTTRRFHGEVLSHNGFNF